MSQFQIRMPQEDIAVVDEAAVVMGLNRSAYVRRVLDHVSQAIVETEANPKDLDTAIIRIRLPKFETRPYVQFDTSTVADPLVV